MSLGRLTLFNHLGCPKEHFRWNRDAKLLGRFQIDDQVELCWPLYGEIRRLEGWLGKDLVHILADDRGLDYDTPVVNQGRYHGLGICLLYTSPSPRH